MITEGQDRGRPSPIRLSRHRVLMSMLLAVCMVVPAIRVAVAAPLAMLVAAVFVRVLIADGIRVVTAMAAMLVNELLAR